MMKISFETFLFGAMYTIAMAVLALDLLVWRAM